LWIRTNLSTFAHVFLLPVFEDGRERIALTNHQM
jgi:hypothetical protein